MNRDRHCTELLATLAVLDEPTCPLSDDEIGEAVQELRSGRNLDPPKEEVRHWFATAQMERVLRRHHWLVVVKALDFVSGRKGKPCGGPRAHYSQRTKARITVAYMALVVAASRFDPKQRSKFGTHASWWMRHARSEPLRFYVDHVAPALHAESGTGGV